MLTNHTTGPEPVFFNYKPRAHELKQLRARPQLVCGSFVGEQPSPPTPMALRQTSSHAVCAPGLDAAPRQCCSVVPRYFPASPPWECTGLPRTRGLGGADGGRQYARTHNGTPAASERPALSAERHLWRARASPLCCCEQRRNALLRAQGRDAITRVLVDVEPTGSSRRRARKASCTANTQHRTARRTPPTLLVDGALASRARSAARPRGTWHVH